MTTTPMLEAWTQKPHSNEIPPPNVASRIISPIHVSDQAATAAATLAALGRSPPRLTPMIAITATEATPPNRNRSAPTSAPPSFGPSDTSCS